MLLSRLLAFCSCHFAALQASRRPGYADLKTVSKLSDLTQVSQEEEPELEPLQCINQWQETVSWRPPRSRENRTRPDWGPFTPFDEEWTRLAFPQNVISAVYSDFDKDHTHDRRWKFAQGRITPGHFMSDTDLQWTNWTPWAANWSINCPKDYAMTGINSKHRNDIEDRTYRLRCNKLMTEKISMPPGSDIPIDIHFAYNGSLESSYWTKSSALLWTPGNDQMIVGMHSYRIGHDRKFRFTTAKYCWYPPA